MNKHIVKSCAALALASAATVGWAAAYNNTQQGSLLVYPLIAVYDNVTTVIQIGNDNASDVSVKCYFMDEEKEKVDMAFKLTRYQTLAWDASTGEIKSGGSGTIQSFPGAGKGLLACWAIQSEDTDDNGFLNPIKWNHLFGKTTLYDFGVIPDEGTGEPGSSPMALEYSASAFRGVPGEAAGINNGAIIGNPDLPGQLLLNNVDYDACTSYLKGQFLAPGTTITTVNDRKLTSVAEFLSVAACRLDFRQEAAFVAQKLVFNVWDSNETKKTGADSCADSYFFYYLGDQNPDWPWADEEWRRGYTHSANSFRNFLQWYLAPYEFGYYRLVSEGNTVCDYRGPVDNRITPPVPAAAQGLMAVQGSVVAFDSPEAEDMPTIGSGGEKVFLESSDVRIRKYGEEASATNLSTSNAWSPTTNATLKFRDGRIDFAPEEAIK